MPADDLVLYTIYSTKTADWPGLYVCRPFDRYGARARPICCVAEKLSDLRAPLQRAGLVRLLRQREDDSVIIETWL